MDLPQTSTNSFSIKFRKLGAFLVTLACFFTPLSTSLLGIFSLLAVTAWLIGRGFTDLPRVFIQNPSTVFAVLLFGLMGLAVFYSAAEALPALDTLKKYRELLLLPVMVSLLSSSITYRETAENYFVYGCIVLLLISYGMALNIIPEERYGHSLIFHITHSFFMAILAFWALHRTFEPQRLRYLWIIIFLATVINIFYIAPGRTGMLVFFCLMVLFLYQRLSVLQLLGGILLLSTTICLIYFTSDNFSGRIREVVTEIENYQPGHSRTSIGQRFDWWQNSIILIKDKPVLGHGTGSFPIVHNQLEDVANGSITETDNPHNEFLFLSVQFGLVGLLLYGVLILLQLFEARDIPDNKRWLLQGVLLALLSGSLINSLLFDSQQGHFYLFMAAALLSGRPRNTISHDGDTFCCPE